jgi:hypothetical protein
LAFFAEELPLTVREAAVYLGVSVQRAGLWVERKQILRRMLNVAVRKKLLVGKPRAGVEFPVPLKGPFRQHYVTWSEQQKIEAAALDYLGNPAGAGTMTGNNTPYLMH